MPDSGDISWHHVAEEVKEPLDAIAKKINTSKPMASYYTTCQLPRALLRHDKDKLLYLLMGYLIAKIKGPERWLSYCYLGNNGKLYISWTTGKTGSAHTAA